MGAAAVKIHEDGDCSAVSTPAAAFISDIPAKDRSISLGETFRLESGEALADPALRIRLFGPAAAPLIAVAGGISAGRKVADADDGAGWWRDLARPGGAVDVARFRILGFDFLPGREAKAVTVTPHDQARALAIGLDALGIASLHGFIGASYGGFVGLAFSALYPERLGKLCAVSAAARPDPMATALRGLQRRIIALATESGREADGVALARALAMTTYRSPEEFRARFECAPLGERAGDLYDVCGYLQSRGEAYAKTMTGARYISLSDSLDRATIDAARITADCLFIASSSDRLVPARDTEETARAVSGRSTFLSIDSLVGHDAFLCEVGKFGPQVKEFIEGE
jgi:homoserine O-acetyltransferase